MTQQKHERSDATKKGEGNHEAARRYQDAQKEFAQNGPVREKAREAADAVEKSENTPAAR